VRRQIFIKQCHENQSINHASWQSLSYGDAAGGTVMWIHLNNCEKYEYDLEVLARVRMLYDDRLLTNAKEAFQRAHLQHAYSHCCLHTDRMTEII